MKYGHTIAGIPSWYCRYYVDISHIRFIKKPISSFHNFFFLDNATRALLLPENFANFAMIQSGILFPIQNPYL